MLRPIVRVMFRFAFKQNNVQTAIFENPDDHAYFVDANLLSYKQGNLIQSVGVNLAQFSYTPLPNTKPIVVMVSRLLWEKGVGLFVEAARRIQKTADVRMVLVGMPDNGNPTSFLNLLWRGGCKKASLNVEMAGGYESCLSAMHYGSTSYYLWGGNPYCIVGSRRQRATSDYNRLAGMSGSHPRGKIRPFDSPER